MIDVDWLFIHGQKVVGKLKNVCRLHQKYPHTHIVCIYIISTFPCFFNMITSDHICLSVLAEAKSSTRSSSPYPSVEHVH